MSMKLRAPDAVTPKASSTQWICSSFVISFQVPYDFNLAYPNFPGHIHQQLQNTSIWAESCPSKMSMLKSYFPVSQYVIAFRDKVCKGNEDKMRSYGWALIHYTGVCIRRGDKDTDLHGRKNKGRHREKMTTHKPKREASEETLPSPWSQTSRLQNSVKLDVGWLSLSVYGVCCSSSNKLVLFFL